MVLKTHLEVFGCFFGGQREVLRSKPSSVLSHREEERDENVNKNICDVCVAPPTPDGGQRDYRELRASMHDHQLCGVLKQRFWTMPRFQMPATEHPKI